MTVLDRGLLASSLTCVLLALPFTAPAADAITRFEDDHTQSAVNQCAGGGKAGDSRAKDNDIRFARTCIRLGNVCWHGIRLLGRWKIRGFN